MPTKSSTHESQPLIDWPNSWDIWTSGHASNVVQPSTKRLFAERLRVILHVLANVRAHQGLGQASDLIPRIYNSRSARAGAAVRASALDDETLSFEFLAFGSDHLNKFNCVEADVRDVVEGYVPYDWDDDGIFLHVCREDAEYGVGLHRLAQTLVGIAP
ncbi:MAG: hypothetical protein ABL931_05800 [Usitatibacteraceae bacterium]